MTRLLARLVARWQARCTHVGCVRATKIAGDWRLGWIYWCRRCGAVSCASFEGQALVEMSRPNAADNGGDGS